MEEVNPVQDPPNPAPPQPQPPPSDPAPPPPPDMAEPPPPPPPPSQPAESKKRPLQSDVQENVYFKMRNVVNDIRPHILEVLRTVDFRNCKAADEVQEKLNLLMELYKQMTAETVTRSITKPKIARESHAFSGENETGQKPQEQLQNGKQQAGEVDNQGHIIGGSAFGWNFVTFPGNEPIYYGRTKESFRTSQVTST